MPLTLQPGDAWETYDGEAWLARPAAGGKRAAPRAEIERALALSPPDMALDVARAGHGRTIRAVNAATLARAVRALAAPCEPGACARCDGERAEHVSRSPVVAVAVREPARPVPMPR